MAAVQKSLQFFMNIHFMVFILCILVTPSTILQESFSMLSKNLLDSIWGMWLAHHFLVYFETNSAVFALLCYPTFYQMLQFKEPLVLHMFCPWKNLEVFSWPKTSPKSQNLFHQNRSPSDLHIMTLDSSVNINWCNRPTVQFV